MTTTTDPRTEHLTVAQVMTAPAPTIDSDASLFEVIHRIIRDRDPELVVTIGSRPVGIITARQIVALLEPDNATWRPSRAIDFVDDRVIRLLPDLTLPAAARALTTTDRYDALPVVDYRGDLIGVLAHRHLVAHIAHAREP
jgi:CBS domain-containing protein